MSLENFIPEVWSARLLENLRTSLVYGQPGVVNRDYEGDIRQAGDTVRITAIGAVANAAYTKNATTVVPETLDDAQTILSIDQCRYFAFQIDDVDRAQQRPNVMEAAMREAAYSLANTADQYLASLWSQVDEGNYVGSVGSPKTGYTAAQVYEFLVELKVVLDTNDVPREGRFCIVPPFLEGYLLKDDRFVKSGTESGVAALMNGQVGRAAGFQILSSNNVPSATATTGFKVIAGHPTAWTYAEQVRQVEAYRPEGKFADAVKGLHLYGAKVVRPRALACLVINAT